MWKKKKNFNLISSCSISQSRYMNVYKRWLYSKGYFHFLSVIKLSGNGVENHLISRLKDSLFFYSWKFKTFIKFKREDSDLQMFFLHQIMLLWVNEWDSSNSNNHDIEVKIQNYFDERSWNSSNQNWSPYNVKTNFSFHLFVRHIQTPKKEKVRLKKLLRNEGKKCLKNS